MREIQVIEENGAKALPLFEREYILLHDDITAELCLIISKSVANYPLSEKRDEMFGRWREGKFEIYCFLDNSNSRFSTEVRYEIFKAHIKNSLISMMRGERKFTEDVLDTPVREIFYSKEEKYHREYENFLLKDYIWEGNQFSHYDGGYDYSKLRRSTK